MTDPSPERLWLERADTPIGRALIVTDECERLRALDFEGFEARMQRLLRLHYGLHPELTLRDSPSSTLAALGRYFQGALHAFGDVVCATSGTAFQRRVWAALREIGPGGTLSYGALALEIGHPSAVRAVGLANGQNPIAIAVPCHRVVGKNGALTGYAGGLERKRWLLAHEARWQRHAATAPAAFVA